MNMICKKQQKGQRKMQSQQRGKIIYVQLVKRFECCLCIDQVEMRIIKLVLF